METTTSYDGPERRSAPRFAVNFRALWGVEGASREGAVTELSTDGCFVLADGDVAAGQLLKVEMHLAEGGHVTLWGHAASVAEGIGFGVRFAPFIHEDDRKKLAWLVSAAARQVMGIKK